MPSTATLREWFSLPLASPGRVKAGGMGSVPIVLPEGGKSVLAKIAWPDDDSRQARFAGRGDPYGLSRKEYLELANSDGFRMLSLMSGDLLAAWAIRAARRKPELAKQPEPLLRFIFTSQLVFFLLGPEKDVGQLSGGQIVRRHLLAENWKFTIELMTLDDRRGVPRAGREKGTAVSARNARLRREKMAETIGAMAKGVHPALQRWYSTWIEEIRSKFVESGTPPPGRRTIRHALPAKLSKP
jgi:hypothetical protein